MSKKKVVQTKKSAITGKANKKLVATVSKNKSASSQINSQDDQLLFGRENYILMLTGIGLIALGMILMLGGGMDDPNVWDESVIYSFRRTVLSPVVILVGLVIEIFAIFK